MAKETIGFYLLTLVMIEEEKKVWTSMYINNFLREDYVDILGLV